MCDSLKCSALVILFLLAFAAPIDAGRRQYSDTDWNVLLLDNCGMPAQSTHSDNVSASWVSVGGDRKLRFVLNAGDVGRCASDSRRRDNAPFWERAELRQLRKIVHETPFEVRFSAQFIEGFTGSREAFFQLHGWSQECTAAPLAMLKAHNGILRLELLQGVIENGTALGDHPNRGSLRAVSMERVLLRSLARGEHVFRMSFSMANGRGLFSLWLNDRRLVENAAFSFQSCVTPRIKLGIYRPGGGTSGRSVLFLDDVWVRDLPNAPSLN